MSKVFYVVLLNYFGGKGDLYYQSSNGTVSGLQTCTLLVICYNSSISTIKVIPFGPNLTTIYVMCHNTMNPTKF